ncbi:WD40 repeat domain-containing protein [Corynebacterium tuscaniense]|uniref:WD40 repeat domain-containing protein n=1 Tax=Corynebacterium tuscaniense TaxID=302449 RepID=UPI00123A940E|nr:WD40 repeat domain-containing protein [Corynebacterium tuscaniense]KAA8744669.1 WD40 repeat domain-containing protein [Corynebacterium tuscaniense]
MKALRLVPLAATCLLLAGCSPAVQNKTEDVLYMGNAEPAESPAASDPDGEIIPSPAITDIDTTGGILGVRLADALQVGDLAAFRDQNTHTIDVDASSGDVSANAGFFAIVHPNDNEVELISAATGKSVEHIPVGDDITVAAPLTGNNVITGSDSIERVWVYSKDGAEQDTFKVARPSDYILAQSLDSEDRVVRVNRFDTTIQDLHMDEGSQGGTLRVGFGVGKVAFGEDGVVLAADATGDRLFIYTTDEVIRLHQMVPTDGRPWAVAWDSQRNLAWVTSTANNTVVGYDISQGVPLEKMRFKTVTAPQSLVALDGGTLVIGSATGDGLQIINPGNEAKE